MIKSLEIKNFQSHEHTKLDFHPGINVICGKSTSGKTAIIRALRWVCFNRPAGLRFLSNFTENGTCEVILKKENGSVGLRKDSKGAEYTLDGSRHFSKLSTNLPDHVIGTINLSEINFQDQLEQHFLITDTPGQVAATINKLTKIENVDEWVSGLTTDINSCTREILILNNQIDEHNKQLLDPEYLQAMEEAVEQLESLLEIRDRKQGKKAKLESYYNELGAYEEKLSVVNDKLRNSSLVEELIADIEDVKDLHNKHNNIDGYIKAIKDINILNEDLSVLQPAFEFITEMLTQRREVLNTYVELKSMFTCLEGWEDKLSQTKIALENARLEYDNYIKSIGVCPFCGTTLL